MSHSGDNEAGQLPGGGVIVNVMHARDARHIAEDPVVRAGEPAEQVNDRQPDCDEHSVEHAESKDSHGGQDRQQQLAAAERAIRRSSPTSINRTAA